MAAAILIIRITYVQLFSAPFFSSTNVLDEVRGFASNTYAIVTLLGGCIMLVSFPFRLRVSHPRVYLLTVAVLLLSLTLVITLFTYYNFPSGNGAVMDRDAMLMIVRYCIELKGESVRYPYILTVARNWANEGVRTVADVERKLDEYEAQSEDMRAVLSALGRKGGAELEEKQMLTKWTRSWGFTLPAVLEAAKSIKAGKTFRKLDARLDEFYRMGVFTADEMKEYNARREHLQELAVNINKTIGVFYESLDHVIEVYTSPWLNKGFSEDALLTVAHYCFLSGIRTLEGMNGVVEKFYSQGLLTVDAVNGFIGEQVAQDERIKKIVEATGRERAVTASDRSYYRTWSGAWGFSDDVILYAAELSAGRSFPASAVNRLLSEWKSQEVHTVEDARRAAQEHSDRAPRRPSSSKNFDERNYTDDEIRSAMVSIDDLEDEDL